MTRWIAVAALCLVSAGDGAFAQMATGRPPAGATSGPGEEKEPPTGESGPAMSRLTVTQRRMAELMRQAHEALKQGTAPGEVAKKFYADLAGIEGLKSPMVALNDLKTRLTQLGLADAVLGEKFPLGGTPVERTLLVYRRDLTMDCIRAAVAEVARRFGADKTGKVFLAKIGKWAVQNPDMFMLAGDIDFSFVGARPEVLLALRDAFAAEIRQRSGGLDMVAIDSVATAHGFAEHMVYMGIQGRKYADDAMMGMDTGVEQIDFHAPDATGTARARQVSGKQALIETVLEETGRRYREEGHEARGRTLANETERAWNDRRGQTVEPLLSMEMARHLEHDIIANVDVFTALDLVKKGAKYLRRSNDQITSDLKVASASPDWAKFVEQVDEKAKKASAEELSTFIYEELKKIGMEGVFELKVEAGKPAVLEATAGGADRFLAKVKEQIWKNVSSGLDYRIRAMTDALNLRGRAAGPGTPDDLRPDRIQDTVRMLAAGLEAMQHDHGRIPPDIVTKAAVLVKLVEAQARQRAFALPEAEMAKIREVLREAAAHENSLLLKSAAVADHIDKWMARNYDALAAKIPASLRPAISVADAKIDALNNLLDHLDNSTVAAMRERGIIKAPIPVGLSKEGEVQFLKVAEFPSIGAINRRLNESVLGKIGNSTAFKAFNLAQEGDAYYGAIMQAATPSEAFQNLATEIFRRRVPGGGAVEAAVMGNYVRVGVEVVYLIYPPLAVPEGLYGLAVSVKDKYDGWWWSSELARHVDTFYAGARFEQVPPAGLGAKPRYRLTELRIRQPAGDEIYRRGQIEDGTAAILKDPDIDRVLWENIAATDPFIQLMEEMKKHEAAGEKVRAHFQRQIADHWAKLRADFGKNLIERFENRRASESAIGLGEVPELYAELLRLADALEIRDPLHAAMDADWDSNYLQRLWVWLKGGKRGVFSEAPPEAEATRAVTILRRNVEAYRKVHEARTAAESGLEAIFADAGVEPPPPVRDNRRVLTGIVFLRCATDADAALAARLRGSPATTLQRVRDQFDAIIAAKAPGAKRDDAFDRNMAARITGEVYWSSALRATRAPIIARGDLERAIAAHTAESVRLFDEFAAHYVAGSGALAVRVRQWLRDRPSDQPVTGASLDLSGSDGAPVAAEFREVAEGTYQALGVRTGQYDLAVSAPGFVARSGEPRASVTVDLAGGRSSREIDVFLKPAEDPKGLGVRITPSIEPALIYTLGTPAGLELRATVTAQRDSGRLTYQWSVGSEVLRQGEGVSAVEFSAAGREPGDFTVSLYVRDEKEREGTGQAAVRVVDGAPLKVTFGEHRPQIFKDQDETLRVTGPAPGPGLGFSYQWVFRNAEGRQVFAQDGADLDRQLIAGQNYAGQTLAISVRVRDRDGRTGTASTTLAVSPEDAPLPLPVSIEPASGTVDAGGRVELKASVRPFADSGAIRFSWDDGKTWSERASGAVAGEPADVGRTYSVTVRARDARGREGEATAGIRVVKAAAPGENPPGDPSQVMLDVTGPDPAQPRVGDTVKLSAAAKFGGGAVPHDIVWFAANGFTELRRGPAFETKAETEGLLTLWVAAFAKPMPPADPVRLAMKRVRFQVAAKGGGSRRQLRDISGWTIRGPEMVRFGQPIEIRMTEPATGYWGHITCTWSHGKGRGQYGTTFTPDKPGVYDITVTFTDTTPTWPETPLGTKTHRVVVPRAPVLTAPKEVMETDVFDIRADLAPELAGRAKRYSWGGADVVEPWFEGGSGWDTPRPQTRLQFRPRSVQDGARPLQVGVNAGDENRKEVDSAAAMIVVHPVRITAAAADGWTMTPTEGGLTFTRKIATRRRPEGGKEIDSAQVSGSLTVELGSVSRQDLGRERAAPEGAAPFAIGGFKGYLMAPAKPTTRYRNPWGYVDASSPEAHLEGSARLVNGRVSLGIGYRAGGSGAARGPPGKVWWDDMPFLVQQTETAAKEIAAMIASVRIGTDRPVAGGGGPLRLSVTASTTLPRYGQVVDVVAEVSGGKPPYVYEWSGDHAGTGAKVAFVSRRNGDHKLSVTVRDAQGDTAGTGVVIRVTALDLRVMGLPPEAVYGQSTGICAVVAGAKGGAPERLEFVWQSDRGLTFSTAKGGVEETTVRFDRPGPAKIWVEALARIDGAAQTVGESPQVVVDVRPPAFALRIQDPAPKVGREVPVSIVATPPVAADLIDYRWLEPPSAQRRDISGNADRIGVLAREARPLALVARARVPGSGDDLGEIRGAITAATYRLKAWVVEPGVRPRIWKEGTGLVPVARGTYAGDERVGVAVDFDGEKPDGEVRWSWVANEGTTLASPASPTPTASRHETGEAALTVTARDRNGIVLGTAGLSFPVSVPASVVREALRPAVTLRADRPVAVAGEPVSFTAEVKRGTPPYRYAWSGATGTGASATLRPAQAGVLRVSVTVTDAKGESAAASIDLEARRPPPGR